MLHHLDHEGKRIILVGTAHVSKESVDLVEAIIEDVKPDTVCVELCESRAQSIRQKDRWQEMDIIKVMGEDCSCFPDLIHIVAKTDLGVTRLEVAGGVRIQAINSAKPWEHCACGSIGYPHHLVADLARHGAVRQGQVALPAGSVPGRGGRDQRGGCGKDEAAGHAGFYSGRGGQIHAPGAHLPHRRTGPLPDGKDPHGTRADHCRRGGRRPRTRHQAVLGPAHRHPRPGIPARQKPAVRIL